VAGESAGAPDVPGEVFGSGPAGGTAGAGVQGGQRGGGRADDPGLCGVEAGQPVEEKGDSGAGSGPAAGGVGAAGDEEAKGFFGLPGVGGQSGDGAHAVVPAGEVAAGVPAVYPEAERAVSGGVGVPGEAGPAGVDGDQPGCGEGTGGHLGRFLGGQVLERGAPGEPLPAVVPAGWVDDPAQFPVPAVPGERELYPEVLGRGDSPAPGNAVPVSYSSHERHADPPGQTPMARSEAN